MQHQPASFWQSETTARPVERRLWWPFDGHKELTVFIYPAQAVPALAHLSEKATSALELDQSSLSPDTPVAPGFVFAPVVSSSATDTPVVIGPGHREIPVIAPPARPSDPEVHSMQARMDQTNAAVPPAPVTPGDQAVGLLVRTEILSFHPIVIVGTDAEVHSYREGTGSTDDLLRELPFQS